MNCLYNLFINYEKYVSNMNGDFDIGCVHALENMALFYNEANKKPINCLI